MRLRSAKLSPHSPLPISEYGSCAESQAEEHRDRHRQNLSGLPLKCCDGQRVPCHLSVNRQELETLFLGLNQQQLGECVFVFKGCVEFSCGVSDGDWKKRHVLTLEHSNNVIWIKGALPQTSSSAGIVLQPHLPDRNCAYVDLHPRSGKEMALDFGESPGCRHQVIQIGRIEENPHLRYN